MKQVDIKKNIEQLEAMIEFENKQMKEQRFGALLTHWAGTSEPIRLDADALKTLVEYYQHLSYDLSPKERFELIARIVDRAQELGITVGERITQMMDIQNADKQFRLRLTDFLNADGIDFTHDFCGIQHHINRETGKVEDFFLPRFAGRRDDDDED